MKDGDKYYAEGRADAMQGVVKNPYKPGTPERIRWQRGRDHQMTWLHKYWEYKRNSSLFS